MNLKNPFFPGSMPHSSLPFSSPGIFEFLLEKEEKGKHNSTFPQAPSPRTKWFVNKEERMVLNLVLAVSVSDWKLSSHENEMSFLAGQFFCISHCGAKVPLLSCPFPEVRVYLGVFPTSAHRLWCCHLHFSANCCSLNSGWRQALRSCHGCSELKEEGSLGSGPCRPRAWRLPRQVWGALLVGLFSWQPLEVTSKYEFGAF